MGDESTLNQHDTTISLISVIHRTLANNPDIRVQKKQLHSSKANILSAEGEFDTVMNANLTGSKQYTALTKAETSTLANNNIPNDEHYVNKISYGVGLSKKLDLGVTLGAGLSITNSQDNLERLAKIDNQQTGTIELLVTIPINRSFKKDIVKVDVLVAKKNYQETHSNLAHGTSLTILNNIILFWDYLAKAKQLNIAKTSEWQMKKVYRNIKTLVKAKEMPRAEIGLVAASLAEKRSSKLSAEFSLLNAKKNLGRAIGLSARESFSLASPAKIAFPTVSRQKVKEYTTLENELLQDKVTQALNLREDLKALAYRHDAISYQLKNARNELKSNVDLNIKLGYSGLSEGSSWLHADQILDRNIDGPSISASVTYQQPYGNSFAKGRLFAQQASLDSLNILIDDLKFEIAANIQLETNNLLTGVKQLKEENISIASYQKSLRNEHLKRNLGLSTWLDIINISDRLERARLQKIQIQQKIVVALAKLTFERGTLIVKDEANEESFTVNIDTLN